MSQKDYLDIVREEAPHLFHWQPTMNLRFIWRGEPVDDHLSLEVRVLQQEWVELKDGTLTGNKEWRDVPLEEEE